MRFAVRVLFGEPDLIPAQQRRVEQQWIVCGEKDLRALADSLWR